MTNELHVSIAHSLLIKTSPRFTFISSFFSPFLSLASVPKLIVLMLAVRSRFLRETFSHDAPLLDLTRKICNLIERFVKFLAINYCCDALLNIL